MKHFALQSFNAARKLYGKVFLRELGVNGVALRLRASLRFVDGLVGCAYFGIDGAAHVNRQLSIDGRTRPPDVFFVIEVDRWQDGNDRSKIDRAVIERFAPPDLLGVKLDLWSVQAARTLGFAFALGRFGGFNLDGVHPVVSKLPCL